MMHLFNFFKREPWAQQCSLPHTEAYIKVDITTSEVILAQVVEAGTGVVHALDCFGPGSHSRHYRVLGADRLLFGHGIDSGGEPPVIDVKVGEVKGREFPDPTPVNLVKAQDYRPGNINLGSEIAKELARYGLGPLSEQSTENAGDDLDDLAFYDDDGLDLSPHMELDHVDWKSGLSLLPSESMAEQEAGEGGVSPKGPKRSGGGAKPLDTPEEPPAENDSADEKRESA